MKQEQIKQYGIPGRARLFEVKEKIKEINKNRKKSIYNFKDKSYNDIELKQNKYLELDYIIAEPRMSLYIKYSTKIYNIYLKYLSKEDIYVYSIDEVFIDITKYLKYYNMTARQLITKILLDILKTTGITATSGVGTNLYLAKIAMDIVAKHVNIDENGVRIAYLNEERYKKLLWNHKPLTDFWRVGKGYAKKLEEKKLYTMGDIARCSIKNEDLLFKLFGINAELLIDHAWGYEPCTIEQIKKYKPQTNSLTSGQVLHSAYDYKHARLIVKEMVDNLSLELVEKNLVSDNIILNIGYEKTTNYEGECEIDRYGRTIPKGNHTTCRLPYKTSSSKIMIEKVIEQYDQIINKNLMIKRINISVNNVISKDLVKDLERHEQIDLFSNFDEIEKKSERIEEENENKIQNTILNIKKKYGKNSILKGMNLEEGSTTIERNNLIGGHKE